MTALSQVRRRVRARIQYIVAVVLVAGFTAFAIWAVVTGARHDRACEEAGGVPRGTLCLAPEAIVEP